MRELILKLRVFNALRSLVSSLIVMGVFVAQSFAQPARPGKKSLCVGPIVAIEAITTKAKEAGRDRDLRQVIQSLDTTLVDQVNGSRKFDVVARKSALKSILEEQDFGASGNVNPASAAKIMQLAGAQFIVMTTITDFAYGQDKVNFKGIGVSANRESVRVNCSIQVYDTTTGKLLESARFRGTDVLTKSENPVAAGETLTRITDKLSADIFNRVVDVIYPAKVVAKLGTQVTINRGDGTGIAVGQTWGVYALGEAITDPDTGEILGQNEAEVGLIRINRITPKLSYGEAFEDNGITRGAILRLKEPVPQKTESKQAKGNDKEKKGGLINSIKNDF